MERLNAHLKDFEVMLTRHIESVVELAKLTEEVQVNRYNGHRLATYGEDEHVKYLDRQDRIKKLKERGWNRQRFDPERYRSLCKKALAEL